MLSKVRYLAKDRFRKVFEAISNKSGDPVGVLDPELERRRKNWTRWAIQSLAISGSRDDLSLVRDLIDSEDIGYSNEVCDYLAKYGTYEDIFRLLKMVNQAYQSLGLMMSLPAASDRSIARAILKLSERRLGDVMELDLPYRVRTELFLHMSQSQFSKLSQLAILRELDSNLDRHRTAVSLRCIQTKSSAELRSFRDLYWSRDQPYYYDVVHWFDFGLSVPARVMKVALKRELAEI